MRLALDGAGRVRVATGAGIYDHFLEQLAFHGGLDLVLEATGDLETGPHHTAEDAALALGEALDRALGDRRGIARYGDAVVPMDDALARASIDLGGRPWCECSLERETGPGEPHAPEPLLRQDDSGSTSRRPVDDDHHVAEAAFKAVGRALRAAVAGRRARPPVDEGLAVTTVSVCDYGAGNTLSVVRVPSAGSERTSASPRSPARSARADLAVLPGVGSAATRDGGPARGRARRGAAGARGSRAGRPSASASACSSRSRRSEEDGGVDGLGLLPGRAVRLREGRVPRIGWAPVEPGGEAYYFAHSYAAETPAATAASEGIVAEVRAGSFVGVQFHPEKSGAAGARYLERCLSLA